MGTGVAIRVCSPGIRSCIKMAAVSVAWFPGRNLRVVVIVSLRDTFLTGQRINAVKRSAVSTGQLRRLPALHTRPIYPVVFREPSVLRPGDLFLEGVSRLDAFSVYPCRT